MRFIEENCIDGELPDGWKTLSYAVPGDELRADYDPEKVQRSMAVMALRRMVERRPE